MISAVCLTAQVGSYSTGLFKFDGKTWRNFTTKDGLVSNCINKITMDPQGNVWAVIPNLGLTMYDGSTFTDYTTISGMPYKSINSIDFFSDGTALVNSLGKLGRFDRNNWLQISSNRSVQVCTIDNSGTIWLRDYYSGLIKIKPNSSEERIIPDSVKLNENEVRAIACSSDGTIWFGGSYVTSFKNSVWSATGYDPYHITGLAMDSKKKLWVFNGCRISSFDGLNWTYYDAKWSTNITSDQGFAIDKNNKVWFGSGTGDVCSFDGTTFTKYDSTSFGYKLRAISSVAVDRSNAKIIQNAHGFLRYNDTVWSQINVPTIKLNSWYTLHPDLMALDSNGNIWFTESEPFVAKPLIYYYDGHNVQSFDIGLDLPSPKLNCLCFDYQNRLWIGTSQGMICFNNNICRRYTIQDGLIDNEINTIVPGDGSNLWIGTQRGVSMMMTDPLVLKEPASTQRYIDRMAISISTHRKKICLKGVCPFTGEMLLNMYDLLGKKIFTSARSIRGETLLDFDLGEKVNAGTYVIMIKINGIEKRQHISIK